MSDRFVDALSAELSGSMEAMAQAIEWAMMYGNDVDAYQFNGIDTYISENATAKKLISQGGSILNVDAALALTDLDAMIDNVSSYRGTAGDPMVFLASPQMISRVSGLQTKMSRESQMVEFEGGFRMRTYRGIPLYPTSMTRPLATTTSPTVTATAAAGGSLADATYYYAISSVTEAGEQLHGVIDDATTATTNNKVNLTWTADANAKLYKIFRGTTTGADNLGLLAVIAAKTYNADGSVNTNVAAWSDDGSLTPNTAIQPLATGEETVWLLNLSPERGVKMLGKISQIGEPINQWMTYLPLAPRKSAFEYMIETFMAQQVPYPYLHAIARRAKTA